MKISIYWVTFFFVLFRREYVLLVAFLVYSGYIVWLQVQEISDFENYKDSLIFPVLNMVPFFYVSAILYSH